MSYSDFTSIDKLAPLGITTLKSVDSLIQAPAIAPSAFLQEALHRFAPISSAINTEKARSEYLIAPILSEIVTLHPEISLFSGTNFDVNSELGLNGYCDFILTANPDRLSIKSPIAVVIEAKNENINAGIAQCVATMYAAHLVNQADPKLRSRSVYGSVTTGQIWRFLALQADGTVEIDLNDRYLTPIDQLLGVLTAISIGQTVAEV
ncbi:MAG: hypothetical protein KME10_18785 [Plectolyngbya sp. WJT66-NPBG17]|jgi:hypothetical protein|nr:hypothetical protein [Plectolyngbya sp. WJT66-NPBG17]